jgi:hypothetical protein
MGNSKQRTSGNVASIIAWADISLATLAVVSFGAGAMVADFFAGATTRFLLGIVARFTGLATS